MTLQTLPVLDESSESAIGQAAGFSLHGGVAARADQRDKLERLCRYISGPAVSEKRLSLTRSGLVRYELKTPYRDGTTHVFFAPLDFVAGLAALVPKPRVNLTRFHGVFAPICRSPQLCGTANRLVADRIVVCELVESIVGRTTNLTHQRTFGDKS